MTRRTFAGIALLIIAGTLGTLPVVADTPETDRLSVALVEKTDPARGVAASPALVRGEYVVDIHGGMAVGTLLQHFAHAPGFEAEAVYRFAVGQQTQITRIELEEKRGRRELTIDAKNGPLDPNARYRELLSELTAEDRAKLRPEKRAAMMAEVERLRLARSRSPVGDRDDRTQRTTSASSEPFPIESEEPVVLATSFRQSLTVAGRMFHLRLPALHDATAPQRASGREGIETLPLSIVVTIHHSEPLMDVRSPSHDVLVDFVGDRTIVETVRPEVPAERPFELEFAFNTREDPTLAGYVLGTDENGRRAVEAVLHPPERPQARTVRPKQMTFVIDSSGSMAGEEKLVQARRAVSACVDRLGPNDRFNLLEFNAGFKMLSRAPVELESFGKANVSRWLDALTAKGGTRLLPALDAALGQPGDAERHAMVVVVTDGILQDEEEVLQLLRDKLGERRLFVVGTGNRVRQQTLLRLAEYGRGAAAFAGDAPSLQAAVAELFDSISEPLGWDLELHADGAELEQISPSRLPDLYAGRPVRVLAWVRGDTPSRLEVRMSTRDGERRLQVQLPPQRP